jgi:hypothetical protein
VQEVTTLLKIFMQTIIDRSIGKIKYQKETSFVRDERSNVRGGNLDRSRGMVEHLRWKSRLFGRKC